MPKRNFSQGGHFTVAHFMQDLAGFGFNRWIEVFSLGFRQILQNPVSDPRAAPEHLESRNDSVPAKDRAEPRNPGVWIVHFRVTDRHHLYIGSRPSDPIIETGI